MSKHSLSSIASPLPQNKDSIVPDDCDKQWTAARAQCRALIYAQLQQLAGRRKKQSVTGVTGGYSDVEKCARGLVSERCGGNNVDRLT